MINISVVMPVFNCEKFIDKAIISLLNQSYPFFEIIIINDGSTDNTGQIIKSYVDKRIKYYTIENSGIGAALNFGIKKSSGYYICRMDADDICHHNRLEIQYNFMKSNPDIDFIGANADVITEEGEFIYRTNQKWKSNYDIHIALNTLNPFIHPTVFYKKSIIEKIGFYHENRNGIYEDYNFHVRVSKYFTMININESVITYRLRKNSFSVRNRSYKYWNIQKKFAITSEISNDELEYLIKFNQNNKKNIFYKNSSYYLTLSRLYKFRKHDTINAFLYMFKSIYTYPFIPGRLVAFFLLFIPNFFVRKLQ